ncbi:MAG: hypothetical protein LBT45_00890 [Rickettsiales bacterium]|jgi:hypothetical protein|nr:hypothetical protein [Rickettsiales bacterium]
MRGNKKILVGFATKTSAVLPSFFCALFRHCAIVADGMLIQIGTDKIRLFRVRAREIRKLENAGWVFVKVNSPKSIKNGRTSESRLSAIDFGLLTFLTCVGFAKRALGIRAPFVWTPDQLFRMLATRDLKRRGKNL